MPLRQVSLHSQWQPSIGGRNVHAQALTNLSRSGIRFGDFTWGLSRIYQTNIEVQNGRHWRLWTHVGQLGTAPVSRLDCSAGFCFVLISFCSLHPRFWFLVAVVSVTAAASRRQKPKRKQHETKHAAATTKTKSRRNQKGRRSSREVGAAPQKGLLMPITNRVVQTQRLRCVRCSEGDSAVQNLIGSYRVTQPMFFRSRTPRNSSDCFGAARDPVGLSNGGVLIGLQGEALEHKHRCSFVVCF
jgi:hypothetical protein